MKHLLDFLKINNTRGKPKRQGLFSSLVLSVCIGFGAYQTAQADIFSDAYEWSKGAYNDSKDFVVIRLKPASKKLTVG